jgi:hypothetical protein
MQNQSRNPRFALGKTDADHGNRGAVKFPRSVARRAFRRRMFREEMAGVPEAETEWRRKTSARDTAAAQLLHGDSERIIKPETTSVRKPRERENGWTPCHR